MKNSVKTNSESVKANVNFASEVIFEEQSKIFSSLKKNVKDYNKENFTLSRLLNTMQQRHNLQYIKPIFAELGINCLEKGGKLKKDEFYKLLHASQIKDAEKDNVLFTSRRVLKDEETKLPILDKDGNKAYEFKTISVKNGGWSLEKFIKVIATAKTLKEKK